MNMQLANLLQSKLEKKRYILKKRKGGNWWWEEKGMTIKMELKKKNIINLKTDDQVTVPQDAHLRDKL